MTSRVMFFGVPQHPAVDFSNHTVRIDKKVSHLYKFKEFPDPKGNRAARRAAKKMKKRIDG